MTLLSMGQTTSTSRLYKSNGRLIADTTFNISQRQLSKWTTIEDSLTKQILDKFNYPKICWENGIFGKIIISFDVDKKGMFKDFILENKYNISGVELFKDTAFNSTMFFSGVYADIGFKADTGLSEKYYLPIDFSFSSDTTTRQIKNGWLTFEMKRYYAKDFVYSDPFIKSEIISSKEWRKENRKKKKLEKQKVKLERQKNKNYR
jgi:hypothetical protein